MNFLELYLKRPVLFDLAIGILLVLLYVLGIEKLFLKYPSAQSGIEILTDVSNLSFTSAGFVLTILTILITFKAGSRKKKKIKDYDSALDLFFQTPLYKTTTQHLKNCIISLLVIAVMGYLLKAIAPQDKFIYVFQYTIFSLSILSLTLMRGILLMNKVLKLQNK